LGPGDIVEAWIGGKQKKLRREKKSPVDVPPTLKREGGVG